MSFAYLGIQQNFSLIKICHQILPCDFRTEISTCHLFWDPRYPDLKLLQAARRDEDEMQGIFQKNMRFIYVYSCLFMFIYVYVMFIYA